MPSLKYSNTNVEAINLAIKSFNWENSSRGKDIHAPVVFFNETLTSRKKTFIDSDLPWMTE